ncbi:hypothetical protein [Nitratireductor indicus]|uniref:hypothetical protein n=1 Tax=Nitratireductor indicus TaxID=721133 RepID=UPI0028758B35|nr:hypothetical protein [Nitratireductor indicus]MDS1134671.1 hypothetical protein [Nitratireductor indicus]
MLLFRGVGAFEEIRHFRSRIGWESKNGPKTAIRAWDSASPAGMAAFIKPQTGSNC